ncbi:unnamed protein product [Triticum turgidum subsp. durum]|uniref:NADH:quinone oxidoreductase/Mrp antiporter membrane subunit domain-containing protein n=1 Tax=Triticum turgidum subsp. durum TaxID=4567 RepID=A0A9R1AS10_TRITD|nr:unnamed protein product [Triticum turgidum subsp. durum]
MKAFHLLLFNGSFIFPECILIFGLILLLLIDSTSDQKDRPWFYFISATKYIECTEMAITEFLLFVLTATLGGMFLCGANNLITIFVAPECFSLCSYLLSGYTKRDLRSNEATMKYLLMAGQALLFWFMVSLGYMVHLGGDRASRNCERSYQYTNV